MEAARLRIRGKVQGVYYRVSARRKALELSLSGWIANLDDGDVEAYVQGEKSMIKEFVKWSWQGPPASNVADVQVEWTRPEEQGGAFEIR